LSIERLVPDYNAVVVVNTQVIPLVDVHASPWHFRQSIVRLTVNPARANGGKET
jgi:hypothetical protein